MERTFFEFFLPKSYYYEYPPLNSPAASSIHLSNFFVSSVFLDEDDLDDRRFGSKQGWNWIKSEINPLGKNIEQ